MIANQRTYSKIDTNVTDVKLLCPIKHNNLITKKRNISKHECLLLPV
jgi:hypothetical protein